MNAQSRIYVAGHRGMVGKAICRALKAQGFPDPITFNSEKLDLRNQGAVTDMMAREKPTHVFVAAAKVGGIYANNIYRADFLYDNLMIEANLIHAAHQVQAEKLLFLGSSCIYPKLADQPMTEDALLTGPLEPTNEPYAIAKIAGIKLCEAYRDQHGANFISAMPTNLYGPGDNYDLQNSHVVPALLRKFHEAKVRGATTVKCWGSGSPRREFLHVDDLADACLFLMREYNDRPFVNVGTGEDLPIKALAETIQTIVGFEGDIIWDNTKPDGTPQKLMNCDRIHAMGWKHSIELQEGLRSVYNEFKADPEAVSAK
ncbi:MAG: GDP-fucose synthetase [Saprospirales bacterium]|nr:GDP-fucose synthetase [Saprospirales bacterium]